ncbi:hypothetical protein WA158_001411 [Blastocystis sp. Blastoise]
MSGLDFSFQKEKAQLRTQKINEQIKISETVMVELKKALEIMANDQQNALKGMSVNEQKQMQKDFYDLCLQLGIDPLSAEMPFLSRIFGTGSDFGKYYNNLGVSVIDICLVTRDLNGGIIPLDDLVNRVNATRGLKEKVSLADVKIAIDKIKPLASYLKTQDVGHREVLINTPVELNESKFSIMNIAQEHGGKVSESVLRSLNLDVDVYIDMIHELMKEGFAWIDTQGSETEYYFPSFYLKF